MSPTPPTPAADDERAELAEAAVNGTAVGYGAVTHSGPVNVEGDLMAGGLADLDHVETRRILAAMNGRTLTTRARR